MMTALRAAVVGVLRVIPIAVWRHLLPKSAVGVCYHMVSDTRLPHLKHYSFLDTVAFEADLAYLKRRFGFLSYQQLISRRAIPNPPQDNAVIVTFDDGFAEAATVAAPILRRQGADCVFFIITDLIDNTTMFRETEASLCIDAILSCSVEEADAIIRELQLESLFARTKDIPSAAVAHRSLESIGLCSRIDPKLRPFLLWLLTIGVAEAGVLRQLATRLGIDPQRYLQQARPYMTAQQIRQLHEGGFTIGAHSRSHLWLGDLPRAEAEQEIVGSCRIIADLTGQRSVPFAFPYSGGGLDRAWLADLRRRHDVVGLMFDTDGLRNDENFIVQRIFGERFGPDRTLDASLRRAWSRSAAQGFYCRRSALGA